MDKTINVKSQLKISLPIAFENLINVLMTLVDTIAISTIGTKELGAMGAMAVVINIMQLSIQTINVTNSSLIAKSIGEKDDIKIKQISGNSIILTLLISLLTIIIAMVIKPVFPTLFNVDKIYNLYLVIRLIGFIPILAYTPLGIFGVWISYLIYNILQKYMSKIRYKEGIKEERNY